MNTDIDRKTISKTEFLDMAKGDDVPIDTDTNKVLEDLITNQGKYFILMFNRFKLG